MLGKSMPCPPEGSVLDLKNAGFASRARICTMLERQAVQLEAKAKLWGK